MRADTDAEVVSLLTACGLWNDTKSWRHLGDIENNYSTIGNQQAEPIAALAEKLVNGVDARLINACLEAGIDPSSDDAPKSIKDAVAQFIGDGAERNGQIVNWSKDKTLSEGFQLTVAATGNMPQVGSPSISIADQAEGQTPDEQPATFMSISRSNKLSIPFVQGKYNMGGTGALNFCGNPNRLQLVVSRRNQKLLSSKASKRDAQWGFTIVRREPPVGNQKHSVYTFLAPESVDGGRDGAVLAFDAEEWPLFPVDDNKTRDAYSRMAEHGSLVKLYEYKWKGSKSNIVSSGDGLLRRLDQALPELALPIRLYECRPAYRGHTGSFSNNLTGLSVRLEQDRADNLDDSLENPRRSNIDIEGQRIRVRVFVFKKGKAENYRTRRNAILMVVNGQTHATKSEDFFTRKSVKLGYLADSLLVILDCSDLSGITRDELFMNSRDRVRENEISDRIMDELEDLLKSDPGLRELQNRRRKSEMEERLADNQPLAEAFRDVLRSDPTLERLFLTGAAISAPFARQGSGEGTGGKFAGKSYPSYWRFKNKPSGEELHRTVQLEGAPRIEFETDVDNSYFDRGDNPDFLEGEWRVFRTDIEPPVSLPGCRMDGPRDGVAVLHVNFPEGVEVGNEILLEVEVNDDTQVEPFTNRISLTVVAANASGGRGDGHSSTVNRGRGERGGSSTLALPAVIPVKESEWEARGFNENSALAIVRSSGDDDRDQLDFFVNVDNKHLRTSQKNGGKALNPVLLERQFMYANVLIGMAMLSAETSSATKSVDNDEEEQEGIEEHIRRVTTALAPVILPMVDVLSSLSIEDTVGPSAEDN